MTALPVTGLDTTTARMMIADKQAKIAPKQKDVAAAAKEFEAVFISQMIGHMFNGIETDPVFGGGEAEDTWRSMMTDEYGKQISRTGGIGLSDSLTQAMIKLQESAT